MLAYFIPIYLVITLAIGFWASSRIKTTRDFTLAGKSLSASFVGVTIFATWFGSSQIMGNPGHFIEKGFSAFVVLNLTGFISLSFIGYFFARKLYEMNIVTVGDFFRIRFNKKMDLAVSIFMILSYPHWIAAQFVALGYLFEAVFGLPINYGIVLGAIIVIVYTYIGGMWAVSYTDMLQSIMIVIGLIILLGEVLQNTGGIYPLFADKPKEFFSPFPSGGFEGWNEYLTLAFAFILGSFPLQEVYQRIFSAKDAKAAVRGTFLGGILMTAIPTIPLIIGLGGAYLHPELMGDDNGQGIIPELVNRYSGTAVQVLFYGAMISAILSTCSGAMLAPATVVGENLIRPYAKGLSDKKILLLTRLSVILVAVASCYFAFNDADIVGLVAASLSLILVCVFAPFTFGVLWKKTSLNGAWMGMIAGGLTWLVCYIVGTKVDPTIIGVPVSCVALIIGSLIWPEKKVHLGSD